MEQNQYTPTDQDQNKDELDVKLLLFKILGNWPYIVVSIGIALVIAYFMNRYATNTYQLKAMVHVKESDNPILSDNVSLAFNWGGSSDLLKSHIAILESYTHNLEVAKKLKWEVRYFGEGNIKENEIYESPPFKVILDTQHVQLVGTRFDIDMQPKSFSLKLRNTEKNSFYHFGQRQKVDLPGPKSSLNFKDQYRYGEWVESAGFRFKLKRNGEQPLRDDLSQYSFQFYSYMSTAKSLTNSIEVESGEDKSSLITLKSKGPNKAKLEDYLNTTIRVLQDYELAQKNQMSVNTINFVDNQLKLIVDTLRRAEKELQEFRSSNQVMDLSSEASEVYTQFRELEQKKAELQLQGEYYDYLQNYVNRNQDFSSIMVPSLAGVKDPILVNLIQRLIELSAKRSEMNYALKKENPAMQRVKRQIQKALSSLRENIRNLQNQHDLQMKQVQEQLGQISSQYAQLPGTEQKLINLRRRYEMSNQQYVYLMEKRSEAAITKAANTPDTRVIEPAIDIGQSPIAPNPTRNYAVALAIGFILPLGVLLLVDLFDTKIRRVQTLEGLSSIPILGTVSHASQTSNLVAFSNPKSSIAESFRAIRTNLQFLFKSGHTGGKVVLITSSVGGEGKTFCSINLASIISMTGARTLIMGADLRKPKIYNDFGISNKKGVSNYLIGQESLESITQTTKYSNLDVISAGPVPPNPSELILSDNFTTLIKDLRQLYDYIILDTPPIGIVADSLQIIQQADASLYIVRQDYTQKEALELINEQYKAKRVQNISLIFNDAQVKTGYGYSYGYGSKYGYGYGTTRGYGYYDHEEENSQSQERKPWWKKLFRT